MSKILNTDVSVLGELNLNPSNSQGRVLTLDVTNKVSYRTVEELASDGADKNYIHDQAISSLEWNINHNLNKKVSVTVIDSSNKIVIGEVEYLDDNNIKITFNAAFTGKAFLN